MTQFSNLNYINVGPKGTFKESGGLHTVPADIDAIFVHLTNTNATKLVVHFHGGLVKESKGEEVARSMFDLYRDDAHPVTFIWETGLIETITRNLDTLASTKLFRKVVKYAIRRAASKLGGGIGGKGPGEEMSLDEIDQELQTAYAFDRFDSGARGAAEVMDEADLDAIALEIQAEVEIDLDADPDIEDILESEPPTTELLDPGFKSEVSEDKAKGLISTAKLAIHIAKIVYRVIKRFINKRDHGFYPTIIEETLRELYLTDFGAWVWGSMKEVAKSMWLQNQQQLGEHSHPGRYFLEKLTAHQQSNPGFIVDLVGHSAGAIAICHLQRTARVSFPALSIRNLLFLAPACTQDLFREEIVSFPMEYERFRMFTMSDDLETKDELLKKVYTRSLLYFISGALEHQADKLIAGIELQLRGKAPYDEPRSLIVHSFVHAQAEQRLVLSKTVAAGQGLNSTAVSHGGFDDDLVTRESLSELLRV